MNTQITIIGWNWLLAILTFISMLTISIQFMRSAHRYLRDGWADIFSIMYGTLFVVLIGVILYWIACLAIRDIPVWFALICQGFLLVGIVRRIYRWRYDRQRLYLGGLAFRALSILVMYLLHVKWIIILSTTT